VRRRLQLDVAAGAEIDGLSLGQAQRQLLDEGGDVVVGFDRAFPLPDAEHLLGDDDLHVLLDRSLAGQPPALRHLTAGEVRFLGRQHLAAAGLDDALALAAGAAAAAGRGEKDLFRRQRLQQLAAGRNGDRLLAVDLDGDIARGDQTRAREQDDGHQSQHDRREHADADKDDFGVVHAAFSFRSARRRRT
jgi:hypothetical protein